jgi:hypothetical protein
MKKIFLAMTALIVGSHVFADVATSSIPMGIDVPKSCTFSNVSTGVIVPEDGSEAVGNFTYTCNMDNGFSTSISMDSIDQDGAASLKNSLGQKLPIYVLAKDHVWTFPDLDRKQTVQAVSGFLNLPVNGSIQVKLRSPLPATTPVGVYTDTFRIDITY